MERNVSRFRANGNECLQAFFQLGFQHVKIFYRAEFAEKFKIFFSFNIHDLIGAECGNDLEFIILFSDFTEGGKVVKDLVCRAEVCDV